MANRRNATPLTRAGDQGYIDKRIVPVIGKMRLDRLRASDLDWAYTRWLDEGLSPATVRKMHAIISSACTRRSSGSGSRPGRLRSSPLRRRPSRRSPATSPQKSS